MKILSEEKFISQNKPTTTAIVTPADTRFTSVSADSYPNGQMTAVDVGDQYYGGGGPGVGGDGGASY